MAASSERRRDRTAIACSTGTDRTGARATTAVTLEMIEAAPSYEARANLVRAFVRQDPERAALVVRQLMQEGANG